VEDVGKEPVSVGRHRDQIDVAIDGDADELARGITHGELGLHLEPAAREILFQSAEVRAIGLDFLGLPKIELIVVASGPAIGDVHEQQPRARQLRELRDVLEDRAIRAGVLDSDENMAVHGRAHENVWTSSQAFNTTMILATSHASDRIQAGETNGPIMRRSLVKITSGITANGSCRLSTT